MLSRSAQGGATSWLALSGPSAVVVGAAGADLDCCVSGELLFCQTRDGGRAETLGGTGPGLGLGPGRQATLRPTGDLALMRAVGVAVKRGVRHAVCVRAQC